MDICIIYVGFHYLRFDEKDYKLKFKQIKESIYKCLSLQNYNQPWPIMANKTN